MPWQLRLRRTGKGYVLGVRSDHSFNAWGKSECVAGTAVAIAQNLPASDWMRLSAGEGTKGARLAQAASPPEWPADTSNPLTSSHGRFGGEPIKPRRGKHI